jgi:hypothetical protein
LPASATDCLFAFVHCEKTAGSTLSGILMAHYGPEAFVSLGSRKDRAGAIAGMRALAADPGPVRTVRGHIPLGVICRYLPAGTRYLTFLRDPLERTVSDFFYLRAARARSLRDWPRRLLKAENEKLTGALERPRLFVDNLQTRMLSGDPQAWRRWREPVGRETLDDAKRSLRERIGVFGLAERFDESLALILPFLGVPRPDRYEHLKVVDHPPFAALDEDDRRAARANNELDLELYEFASALFESRAR